MNSDAFELASLSLYLEAQVADLRTMLRELPRDEYGTVDNRETFARLRGVAVDLMSLWRVASTYSEEANRKEDECR